MENQTELKWYQKPAGVIILLIFFFPVGLYLMWKNELWTKQTRWIVTAFIAVVIIANAGKNNAGSNSSSSTSSSKETPSKNQEKSAVDPKQLSELNEYLQRGQWTCTNVESGTAPFMRGAKFIFSNNKMIVSSEGTTVENKYEITGILPNVPEGNRYSALITINNNKDMLTWIDESLMILSWGGDKAKLRLQR